MDTLGGKVGVWGNRNVEVWSLKRPGMSSSAPSAGVFISSAISAPLKLRSVMSWTATLHYLLGG